MAQIEPERVEDVLLEVAKEFSDEGPGAAQEFLALREAAQRLHIGDDLRQEQALLNSWHKLFREGRLCWGYDLRNPGPPFFHLAEDELLATESETALSAK